MILMIILLLLTFLELVDSGHREGKNNKGSVPEPT